MPMQFGTISYNALVGLSDGVDADPRPDVLPPAGTMTLTASRPSVTVTDSNPAVNYFLPPREYAIGSDGIARDSEGRDVITLEATDSVGVSYRNWKWIASFRFTDKKITREPISFYLPADSHVDVALVESLGITDDGTPIIKGDRGDPGVDGSEYPTVIHGTDPNVARPVTDLPVTWYGSVYPVNSTEDPEDTWVRVYASDATSAGAPTVPGATASTKGTVRLAGDLAGTADVPTVPGLAGKVSVAQISDPTSAAGSAIRNVVNSFGPRVPVAGEGAIRWWPPGTTDPADAADGDCFINFGVATATNVPGLKVHVAGTWQLVSGATAEPGEPPVQTAVALTLSAGDGQITVRPEVIPGTDGVTVTRIRIIRTGMDNTGASNQVKTVAVGSGPLILSNLVNGTTYTITAEGLDAGGNVVGASDTKTATPAGATTPPSTTKATVTLSLTPGSGTITAEAKVVPGTDGTVINKVRISRDGVDSYGTVGWTADVAATPTGSIVFRNLINGTTYNITAKMLDSAGSVYGATVTKPATPSGSVIVTPPDDGGGTGGGGTPGTGTGKFQGLTLPAIGWFSGGTGPGIDNGSTAFATWRGSPVTAMSTWLDAPDGGAWGSMPSWVNGFKGWVDLSPGGPSSWSAAAGGSLDDAFHDFLVRFRAYRTIGGVLYPTSIRPFHEMNGNWYDWSVGPGDETNFKKTAKRWRAVLDSAFPEAIFEFGVNGDTVSGINVSDLWEDGVWDMVGVDQYNQFPFISSSGPSWDAELMSGSDSDPRGIGRWRQFAENRGVPLGLPEFANSCDSADGGTDPYWTQKIYAWIKANAGSGPGQVVLDCWFNEEWPQFQIYPTTNQPRVADAYRAFFSSL